MKVTCALRFLLFLILLVTGLSWLPIPYIQLASLAQSTPMIYVQPADSVFYTNQTFVGDRFNMTVSVRDAPMIMGWQVYMEFDDNMINVTRWINSTSDPQYIFYGKNVQLAPTPPDSGYMHLGPNLARVQVSAVLYPAQTPSSGNGTLCILEFEITRYPSNGTISSPLHINSTDTTLLDPYGNDVASVDKVDGSFSFVFVAVPPLRLVAYPQSIRFTPYQDAEGRAFNTTIFVEGPASAAVLTNVSFTLSFDPSLFSTNESSVNLNDLWTGERSVSVSVGQVIVAVSNPSSLPSDDVAICIITFTILAQQTVPPFALGNYIDCGINFASSAMLNGAGKTIDQLPPYNQTIRIFAHETRPVVLAVSQAQTAEINEVIQNHTLFAVNISITEVYAPSVIQVNLLYDPNVIMYFEATPIGEITSDEFSSFSATPSTATARVLVSEHVNPVISGPIFRFVFRVMTQDSSSNINFSQPYGQDTFIRDSSGATANATYSQTIVGVRLALESSQNILNATVNSRLPIKLIVKNDGEVGTANASLSSEGVPSSWLQLASNNFQLDPKSAKTIDLIITPVYTGEFNITITATPAEGNNATITLTLQVNAAGPPWELILFVLVVIGVGGGIAFETLKRRERKKIRRNLKPARGSGTR